MKSVSIVIPTYNSIRTISECIDSIFWQTYPHELIEIIVADGGSKDGTIEFLKERNNSDIPIRIYQNKLRTAEAGKAVGVRKAQGEIICLLDSDNFIPENNWMERMMSPFDEEEIVASEPIAYTYRENDSVINRYCALIGMNDPLCLFTGNYDRWCLITNKWTTIDRDELDMGDYFSIRFQDNVIPTIGANGFLIRREELLNNFVGDYLFDIDILWELFQKEPLLRVAKVKTGIIHAFCPDTKTFCRKQSRRIKDFLFFSEAKGRKYPWNKVHKSKIGLFIFSCITIIPLLLQSIIGYCRKRDASAWLYHIVACWITLWIYGIETIKGIFGKKEQADRTNWKQ